MRKGRREKHALFDHLGGIEEEGDNTGRGKEHVRREFKVLQKTLIELSIFLSDYVPGVDSKSDAFRFCRSAV